jgi:DNA-binding NarL/FixJ family response regulator
MSRRLRFDGVAAVEACYREVSDDRQWLSEFLEAARPLVNFGPGYAFLLVDDSDRARRSVLLAAAEGFDQRFLDLNLGTLHSLDEKAYRAVWYPPKPILFASDVVRRVASPELGAAFFRRLKDHGCSDGLGALGHPLPGKAFTITSMLRRKQDSTAFARLVLARVRVHLETALRMRFSPGLKPTAILTPGGRIEHLVAASSIGDARLPLSRQVARIESVRSIRRRADCADALAGWRALVEGRWSLAERVDSDGKRFYYAFENAPDAPRYGALTRSEAQLLDQSARGLSGKHTAYALGVSESTVSRGLASAAARLGFASVADLVRVAARALRGEVEAPLPDTGLTIAETEVLALVQRGDSNRQIAESRHASVRTVANQVAAILRKTGAPNRRALLGVELGSDHSEQRDPP